MLQRAASNAYSWWWASHIRTKQSKWLEQNLQDMGEKVTEVLKLIEEDGDSFAKRAEMYYKKRPELISFVEESYRAYRSLAERYDHISTELQNANSTIASVFPEQVQFAMDEDEEAGMAARMPKRPSDVPPGTNIPKVPDVRPKDLKGLLKSTANKLRPKTRTKSMSVVPPTSGLSKDEALKQIDCLQKGILTLQTEKEFKQVSYESSLAKYWEIEAQIREMHDKISKLQDEFGISSVIEDDEARSLMATAALHSCQETLALLQGKQERSAEEARVENRRIRDAKHKLESLRDGRHQPPDQSDPGEQINPKNQSAEAVDEMQNSTTAEEAARELVLLREKIKEQLNAGASSSLTVTEMAEKVDELVTKVVSLESAVSSQTALITRLRTENDDLLTQIRSLEDVRTGAVDGTINLSIKLHDVEEKLQGIEDLSQNIQDQNNNLQTHFTEAHCNLDHLTEKLQGDEISVNYDSLGKNDEGSIPGGVESPVTIKQEDHTTNSSESAGLDEQLQPTRSLEKQEESMKVDLSKAVDDVSIQQVEEQQECGVAQKDGQLSSIAPEDREKVLLERYTSILRDFKEVKKKLGEVEKNHQDSTAETAGQLRELRNTNAKKDEEIQSLRHRLTTLLQKKNTAPPEKNKELMLELKNNSKQQSSSNLLDNHQPAEIEKPMENSDAPTETGNNHNYMEEDEDEDDIDVLLMDLPHTASPIEETFRMNIDELLEQNLDFWLRFSSSFHQIQKFQTGIEDLQSEISKLKGKLGDKQQEGSKTPAPSLKSDARPIYRHLREIQTELTVWVEQSVVLKDELQCRFSSLCGIQEEIAKALKEGAYEHESNRLTGYQAAKFQGEVMNMQQENNKVADELQAGLDHITGLQFEVDRSLAKLNEEFKLSGSKNQNSPQMRTSSGRTRVPLRSFIFGAKQKKQKPSIFACVNPVLQRKYNDIRAGLPMNSRSNSNNRKKD